MIPPRVYSYLYNLDNCAVLSPPLGDNILLAKTIWITVNSFFISSERMYSTSAHRLYVLRS